jgi:hypothetical protein
MALRLTRRRTYLLVAALGIFGMTLVGVWNGARRERELHDFVWSNGFALEDANLVLNAIRIAEPFDDVARRFSYYTGGESGGTGVPTAAPQRIVAESTQGAVSVRLRAVEPSDGELAAAEAAEIARSVSLVTTRIWPGEEIPVSVDVHFMPDGAPFSQAKRVDWREGDAYAIALFARGRSFPASTAAHELYHVLAGRWSLGNNQAAGSEGPNAAQAYEEVAATLFAECGRLLALESLPRDTRNVVVNIDGRRFEDALDSVELAGAIELLRQDARNSHLLRGLLARTVLEEVFGDEDTILLASPQGEMLLARCREAAANPRLFEFRLAEMLGGRSN